MGGAVTIRIVIADDHPIVLDGLELIFAEERDFQVLARASNGDQALQAILQFQPDILVLDLRMPGKDGFAVLRQIERQGLQVKVVVLTAAHRDDVLVAIRMGARGVVMKDMAMRLLADC
jgi:DNA-binding NarL/FixJ family response regulator